MSNPALYVFYRTYGNAILFRYRKNGKAYSKKVDFYKPSLYTHSKEHVEGGPVSIYDEPLVQKQFDSINDAKNFIKTYENVEGFKFEGNSNFANQFIIEFYQGQMPQFDPKTIRIGIYDIEVDAEEFPEPAEAKWPINGVTFFDSYTDTYYTCGDKEYVHDKKDEHVGMLNVVYKQVDSEVDILHFICDHVEEFDYDVTSGWNSEGFDEPYVVNRCYKILGENHTKRKLSPFGMINIKEKTGNFGKSQVFVDIVGRVHLDYMELYKKHIYVPRESYRLDFIASEELGENKLSYEEEGSLQNLYRENPIKFYAYNIKDVKLIKQLDDKLGLFNLSFSLAYFALSNIVDSLGTVKIWENLIAKHLYSKGQIPPFSSERKEKEAFEGAFVHPTNVGFHKWVVSFDLNSLYPHNEIQYNIGSETYIPRDQLPKELAVMKSKYNIDQLVDGSIDLSVLKEYDLCMAGNFEFYRRDKVSFFSEIKEGLYSDRKVYKKKMLGAQSRLQTLKAEASKRGLKI